MQKTKPETNRDKLNGTMVVWEFFDKIIQANITPEIDQILNTLGNSSGGNDPYDF